MKDVRHPKGAALIGFVAGLLVVLVGAAGTAFACTEIRGKITMSGVAAAGSSGSYSAEGKGGDSMANAYCTTPTRKVFTTAAPAAALTFQIGLENDSSCLTGTGGWAGRLHGGVYEVRWIASPDAVNINTAGYPECHFNTVQPLAPLNPNPGYLVLGEMVLPDSPNSDTSATGVFVLPAVNPKTLASTVGSGNICLQLAHSHVEQNNVGPIPVATNNYGNWAPPIIYMKWTTV